MRRRTLVYGAMLMVAACGADRERDDAPPTPPPKTAADSAPATAAAPAPTPATAAAPVVHVHSLAVGGALSQAAGRKVIEHNLPAWRACYVEALKSEPALCGHLSVSIEHKRHGGFRHGYPVASTVRSASLSECLRFDLKAPDKSLAAPGTSYVLTLVFAPSADRVAACSPSAEPTPALPTAAPGQPH